MKEIRERDMRVADTGVAGWISRALCALFGHPWQRVRRQPSMRRVSEMCQCYRCGLVAPYPPYKGRDWLDSRC